MFRRERSLHQSGHTDLFLNYPNSQFYLAFMSRQRGKDVKEGKREKAEGEKEKQGVLCRGGTSEYRFMFSIRRLRSHHVAESKWDVTQSPREAFRLGACIGSRSFLLCP